MWCMRPGRCGRRSTAWKASAWPMCCRAWAERKWCRACRAARLRLKQLKKQDQLAEQTAHALGALPGINQAEANPVTGSVLILFDAKHYPSLDALLKAVAGDRQSAEAVVVEETTIPPEVPGTAEA